MRLDRWFVKSISFQLGCGLNFSLDENTVLACKHIVFGLLLYYGHDLGAFNCFSAFFFLPDFTLLSDALRMRRRCFDVPVLLLFSGSRCY